MISKLFLRPSQRQEMQAAVMAQAPLEACGLLAGKNERVEKIIPVRNQAQSPRRYIMDPYEQLQAFAWIDSQGLDLQGIYHSHPAGPETVSPTDIAEAAYEVVYVIWSRCQDEWQMRGFWIQDVQVIDVFLEVSGVA